MRLWSISQLTYILFQFISACSNICCIAFVLTVIPVKLVLDICWNSCSMMTSLEAVLFAVEKRGGATLRKEFDVPLLKNWLLRRSETQ